MPRVSLFLAFWRRKIVQPVAREAPLPTSYRRPQRLTKAKSSTSPSSMVKIHLRSSNPARDRTFCGRKQTRRTQPIFYLILINYPWHLLQQIRSMVPSMPETPMQQSTSGKEASVSATGCETEYAVELAAQPEEKRDNLGRVGSDMIGNSGKLTTLKR